MTAGIEIENESRDPDYAHFRGGLSSIGYRILYIPPVCKI